jgi:hypothetical protein
MQRGKALKGWRRWVFWAAAAVLLVLVAAQLILPRIAASVVSSRVGRYGKVESVSVSAWPAVKLLWGSVDSVHVRAKSLALDPQQAAKLLWEGRDTARMEMSAERMQVGPLQLTDAKMTKRDNTLTAQAQVGEAAVLRALPGGVSVQLVKSEGGAVEVQASGGLFGVGTSLDAVAQASEGKLVAHPVGFLVEGVSLTLFSDEHVYVEGVSASRASGVPASYELSIRASLR